MKFSRADTKCYAFLASQKITAQIFLDDNRIDFLDENHSDDEERWKVIGMVRNILVVIYTERGEKLRLISARKAEKKEQEEYYGQYPDL